MLQLLRQSITVVQRQLSEENLRLHENTGVVKDHDEKEVAMTHSESEESDDKHPKA
jgi:hypothetical protein